ncbi:uncharacterized protein LOC107700788 [Sinocyclocheilus anshuiensis]|uniref:uncharacterized protein LOC107700788 n=1 Tax=Sinocyclocheilus anshuiensis TaxID=1608454 RepID=UPI0007B8B0B5|nr:PREDICTED: uncharacterized protein LOC107700788 [Sinocyclocheilus anshuiensis]
MSLLTLLLLCPTVTHGSYDDSPKERLFAGSNVKSDSKDCQTSAKSDNQDNHMINYKPSASVPKYDLSGFGHPSVQYESCTDASKNVQPGSRLASTSSQSGSTLMRTLKVPESKPSRGESSYEVAKTAESNKIFVVKPSKTHKVSHQYTSSKGSQSSKLQTANSSYGPFMKGNPAYSSMNPRKPSRSGFTYTEAKSSVVSSGPIFVVQGGGNAQGLGEYSGHPNSVKPLGGPSHVDPYQASQSSRLIESSQGKSRNEPLHYSMSGSQYSPSSEPRKHSKNDSPYIFNWDSSQGPRKCSDNQDTTSYEATHPKFQQIYNIHGQPNQIFKPVYPSQSGAQRDVAKSSNASSGAILMMQAPENVQNGAQSNKPKFHPGFPERKVPFAPGQTAHQYQSGYQTFSVKGTMYKPSSVPSRPSTSKLGFSATNPTTAGSNEINTVHVRLNKPTSSFGSFQNQWASGDISSGAFQSSLPPSYPGEMPGQNVQKPVSSSFHCSKGVQSQESSRRIIAIPSEFGQGAIRRISPTLSSSYRQAEQNQPQFNSLDSLASKCEVTQNSPAGFGQQGPVRFQEANLSI